MGRFLDFLLLFVAQFAGGPDRSENNLVRFGLAAMIWAVLLWVAWTRQRQHPVPREKLLVVGFALGLARELLMLAFTSLRILEVVSRAAAYPYSQPLERALSVAAVVVIAAAFLRYIRDEERVPRAYLRVGLGLTVICYVVTALWWAPFAIAHPDASFGATWSAWASRLLAGGLLLVAIGLLLGHRGWLRNAVLVALTCFLLDEWLMACSLATGELYSEVFCPISHAFHLVGIVLLGYVYIREQDVQRRRAEERLVALNAIATTINQSMGLEQELDAILEKVLDVVPADAARIRLLDAESESLTLRAERGRTPEILQDPKISRLSQQITEHVLASGERTVWAEECVYPAAMGASRCAVVCTPVRVRESLVGALCVLIPKMRQGDQYRVDLLVAIAHQVGVAVENAWLAEEASRAEIWQELNRLRSELIANVSHELRTPLGLIRLSSTSLLAKDIEFDPQTVELLLTGIDEETERLEHIVDNLLDLSQVDSGQMQLNRRPTDLAELARQVITSIAPHASEPRIALNFAGPMVVYADRQRIEQVLRNLLSNALKYSPEGGLVLVQGYEDRSHAYLQVSDEGIGIPAEAIERIFERFYRVQNESTNAIGGVGLGLAVCKSIVEAHGGRIWAESDLGGGSTFWVALPNGVEQRAGVQEGLEV